MTKLRIMSDTHLEFGPLDLEPIGEDVLVLAGDVGLYTGGAEWAAEYAGRHQIPVVMIAGNHEFYRPAHTVDSTLAALRKTAASEPLLHFLQDDGVEVAGVRFIGATLWTDFNLNGDQPRAMMRAAQAMNDYRLIQDEDGRFKPRHALWRHERSVRFLRASLPPAPGMPTVVMTHHLPSPRSIAGRYASSDYNAAYASRLDDLVAGSGAALWIHGHTHVSQDYRIGDTRIICNPRGYYGHELNPDFNPNLIVEVG